MYDFEKRRRSRLFVRTYVSCSLVYIYFCCCFNFSSSLMGTELFSTFKSQNPRIVRNFAWNFFKKFHIYFSGFLRCRQTALTSDRISPNLINSLHYWNFQYYFPGFSSGIWKVGKSGTKYCTNNFFKVLSINIHRNLVLLFPTHI